MTENIIVPDFMPVLGNGPHPKGAKDGACFMEFASYLAGEEWSDHPACANWLLTGLSITVNDAVHDEARQDLIPLVPRVIGTSAWNTDFKVFEGMHAYTERLVPNCAYCMSVGEVRKHFDSAEDMFRAGEEGAWCSLATVLESVAIVQPGDFAKVRFLTQVYDEFDRLAGRDKIEPVTIEKYRAFHDLVNA